jgi:hypothetical protein
VFGGADDIEKLLCAAGACPAGGVVCAPPEKDGRRSKDWRLKNDPSVKDPTEPRRFPLSEAFEEKDCLGRQLGSRGWSSLGFSGGGGPGGGRGGGIDTDAAAALLAASVSYRSRAASSWHILN